MDLICPKCQGAMRQYERSGVTVDQCSECRGIFLDRGELERLVSSENTWYQGGPGQPPPPPPPQHHSYESHGGHQQGGYQQGGYQQGGYQQGGYQQGGYQQGGYQQGGHQQGGHQQGYGQPYRKKKKSFLEELFD